MDADAGDAAMPMGIARLSKLAFDGADLKSVLHGLRDQAASGGAGPAALMDLATLEQLFGNVENGIACQAAALEQRRLYRSPCGQALPALRLMALAAPGDIGTNTPLEFLLEGGDVALDTLYVVPDRAPVAALPAFDLAIVAVGEADSNRPVLDEIADLVAQFHVPVLNDPRRVPLLARDRLPQLLADIPGLIVPPTMRVERARLAAVAEGTIGVADVVPGAAFPIIARPINSHAGRGLKRLCGKKSLATYLAERAEERFFVSPFVDYRSADGLYPQVPHRLRRRSSLCLPHGDRGSVDDLLPQRRHARERSQARRGSALLPRPSTTNSRTAMRARSARSPRASGSIISPSIAPRLPTDACCCSKPTSR